MCRVLVCFILLSASDVDESRPEGELPELQSVRVTQEDGEVVKIRVWRIFGERKDFVPFLGELNEYPKLRELSFIKSGVSDQEFAKVPVIQSLECIRFSDEPNVNDKVLGRLALQPSLREISLSGTSVTGTGFRAFSERARSTHSPCQLQTVIISDECLTDEGLDCLLGVSSIRQICFSCTRMSPEVVHAKLKSTPNLKLFGVSQEFAIGDSSGVNTSRPMDE